MEKFKKVLKIIFRVYSIICTVLFTLLLIAAIVVWANFGKITGSVLTRVVSSYNTEINTIVSNFFTESIPADILQFQSIQTLSNGSLQASFQLENNAMTGIDISGFQNKSNIEILTELGITSADIPPEVKSILSLVKQTLVLDFKDRNGNLIINREITLEEIADFF
jgi:hypothetical protein